MYCRVKTKNKIKSRDKCLQRKRCASGPHARVAVKHSKSHALENVYNFTVPRKGFLLQPFGTLNTRNTRTVMIYILFGFSHPVIFTLNWPLRGMFSLYTRESIKLINIYINPKREIHNCANNRNNIHRAIVFCKTENIINNMQLCQLHIIKYNYTYLMIIIRHRPFSFRSFSGFRQSLNYIRSASMGIIGNKSIRYNLLFLTACVVLINPLN